MYELEVKLPKSSVGIKVEAFFENLIHSYDVSSCFRKFSLPYIPEGCAC